MKKFFSLLLAGALLFSLAACNKITDNPSPNPNPGGPPPAAQDNQNNQGNPGDQGNPPKSADDNEPDEAIVPQAGCTVIKIGKKAYTIHKENATMNDWLAEYGEKEGWHPADDIYSPDGSHKIDFDNAKRDEALKTGDTFELLAEQMPPKDESPEGLKKAAEEAANANTAPSTPEEKEKALEAAQGAENAGASQEAPSDAGAAPNADANAQANAAAPADAAADAEKM